MHHSIRLFAVAALMFAVLPGCMLWRGDDGFKPEHGPGDIEARARDGNEEARLRDLLEERVDHVNRTSTTAGAELKRRSSYWFKEYSVYPQAIGAASIEFREVDSLTAPLMAEVELEKVRYSTRWHRRRDDAVADTTYYRDTGTERLTYEFHNGRWRRAGGLFVADVTEEQVDGVWRPVPDRVQRAARPDEQDDRGWLRRTWDSVFGF